MDFQPLTSQQYQSALDAGYSHDQIVQNELQRKANSTPAPTNGGGFLKSLLSPVATMIARPFQAGAELLGASSQSVDATTKKLTGGLVAPVPQNAADVKKDVGRGIQTVALGAGPESMALSGAGFGLGGSLEQGNDLFSVQTALQTALGAGAGKILGLVGKPLFNVAGKVVGSVTPAFLKDLVSQGNKAIIDFAAQHEILPQFGKDIISATGEKINQIGTATKTAIKDEFQGSPLETGLNKTKGLVTGKTQAEVLATPESKVYKLSPSERKLYFDTQANQITEKSAMTEQQVKEDLARKTTNLQTEAESLNRDLAVASRDEVVNLRPKITKALGEQSKVYRQLVDEALAPHANLPVDKNEVAQLIDVKFSENPQQAAEIKNNLGLGDTETPVTIGDLYNKTKDLGQGIASAAKKGTRVYTPQEKSIDDTIHVLTDYMKAKGVDLTAPRQFWAKYAPIRNQLVSEAKPFLSTGTQTKTFANTLTRVAKGTDVNNENFIKEVENLLGGQIGQDTRSAVVKLDANEKQQLANEVEAKLKIADAQLIKDKALKGLSDKQFEVERKATTRKIVITSLKALGGLAGYNEAKKFLPFLP